jgi:hypothetical protein
LGWVLRVNWLEAQARERAVLRRQVAPKAVLAPPSIPGVQATAPAEYIDVANKMLFSKDRNPIVVVEPPKPAPEPVMPALPSYTGQMAIGAEPVIFLSIAKDVQHSFHAGDQVGDFKLVSFNDDNVVFDWNGKTVERKLEDLRPRLILAQAGAGAGTAASPGSNSGTGAPQAPAPQMPRPSIPTPGFPKPKASADRTNTAPSIVAAPEASATPAPAAAAASPTTSLNGPKPGDSNSAGDTSDDGMFGAALPGGFRACVAADSSPAGTVHSGYRKVQAMSIFGASCDWEPVK